jgi:hypothetical protein
VAGLGWSEDPESYAGGRIATGRGSHAGQVKGDDPDKKGPPGWGLGVRLTTPPCKTWICLETSTEASEEEEGWWAKTPKTGQSAIEDTEAIKFCWKPRSSFSIFSLKRKVRLMISPFCLSIFLSVHLYVCVLITF